MHTFIIISLIVLLVEILIYVWVVSVTNFWVILFTMITTGILGVNLAKKQGIQTLKRARLARDLGQIPGRELLDGIAILIGALLIITPGYVTDLVGLLLLLPTTRNLFIIYLKRYFKDRIVIYK